MLLRVKSRLGQPCAEEAARARRLLAGRTELGEAALLIHHELAWQHATTTATPRRTTSCGRPCGWPRDCGTVGGLDWRCTCWPGAGRRGQGVSALATVARLQQLAVDVEPASANLVFPWALAEAEAATGSPPRAVELAEQVTRGDGTGRRPRQACAVLPAARRLAACRGRPPPPSSPSLHRAHLLPSGASRSGTRPGCCSPTSSRTPAAAGDLAQARGLLAELHGTGRPAGLRAGRPAGQRAEVVLAFAEGRADDAIDLLPSAADRCRALGAPIELYRVLLLAADVERRRWRRGAARGTARRGDRDACLARGGDDLGVDRLAREVARLMPTQNRRDTPLTPMEKRIVALVVQGATNREVARDPSIAVTTVEGSLTKIYRQFQIRSRVELVRAFELIDSRGA